MTTIFLIARTKKEKKKKKKERKCCFSIFFAGYKILEVVANYLLKGAAEEGPFIFFFKNLKLIKSREGVRNKKLGMAYGGNSSILYVVFIEN